MSETAPPASPAAEPAALPPHAEALGLGISLALLALVCLLTAKVLQLIIGAYVKQKPSFWRLYGAVLLGLVVVKLLAVLSGGVVPDVAIAVLGFVVVAAALWWLVPLPDGSRLRPVQVAFLALVNNILANLVLMFLSVSLAVLARMLLG